MVVKNEVRGIMDTTMNMKRNSSNVWPYVIAGSAIGGAVGYLFMSESGRKIRHAITHPDELADNIEEARTFIETKTRMVTDQVHNVLQKAKHGIEQGQAAYQEAGQHYQTRVQELQGKSGEFATNVHKTVDNVNRTAVSIEHEVLHPVVELGALYRGIERGIRTMLGKETKRLYRDTHMMGD
jgi:gas vesicle protein